MQEPPTAARNIKFDQAQPLKIITIVCSLDFDG